jgi:cytoskeletal protein RodZ
MKVNKKSYTFTHDNWFDITIENNKDEPLTYCEAVKVYNQFRKKNYKI